jgi:hypothetical protein
MRNHCVSVYLDPTEIERLDNARQKMRRGTYLRSLFLGHELPVPIPEINRQAYTELARSASNLNQITHRLNMKQQVEITEILSVLREFRNHLLKGNWL